MNEQGNMKGVDKGRDIINICRILKGRKEFIMVCPPGGVTVEKGKFVWPAQRLKNELEKAKSFREKLRILNEHDKGKAISEYREDFHKRMERL